MVKGIYIYTAVAPAAISIIAMSQASPSRTSSHPSVPPSPPPSPPPPSLSCPSKACALCRFVDAPSSVDIDKFNCGVASCRTKCCEEQLGHKSLGNMTIVGFGLFEDEQPILRPLCLVYGWLLYIRTMMTDLLHFQQDVCACPNTPQVLQQVRPIYPPTFAYSGMVCCFTSSHFEQPIKKPVASAGVGVGSRIRRTGAFWLGYTGM